MGPSAGSGGDSVGWAHGPLWQGVSRQGPQASVGTGGRRQALKTETAADRAADRCVGSTFERGRLTDAPMASAGDSLVKEEAGGLPGEEERFPFG